MATKKKRRPAQKKTGKKIHFSLSWSGLISCGLLTLVALVWAFILGVLVGRGYHPESVIPQVARLLPGQSERAPAGDRAGKENQVLKPEELGFFESLQDDPSSGRPSGQASRSSRQGTAGEADEQQARSSASVSKEAVFRYVYQVAAFKSRDQARALSTRLKASGLSSTVKSVRSDARVWYRVHVAFQGSPSKTLEVKTLLKELGCPKPFLRSKTPL